MHSRFIRSMPILAMIVSLGLITTGCFSATMNLKVNDDDTVDISITSLVDTEQLERLNSFFGQTLSDDLLDASPSEILDEVTDGDDPCSGLEESFSQQITRNEISDGSRVGVECVVQGIPIEEIDQLNDESSTVTISRDSGTTDIRIVLTGMLELYGATDEDLEFLDMFDLDVDELVQLNFVASAPGGIRNSNATSTNGATATWELRSDSTFISGDDAIMTATWSDDAAGDGLPGWLTVLFVLVGIAAVVGVIAIVGARQRRSTMI